MVCRRNRGDPSSKTEGALQVGLLQKKKHSRFGLAWSHPRADRGLSRPTSVFRTTIGVCKIFIQIGWDLAVWGPRSVLSKNRERPNIGLAVVSEKKLTLLARHVFPIGTVSFFFTAFGLNPVQRRPILSKGRVMQALAGLVGIATATRNEKTKSGYIFDFFKFCIEKGRACICSYGRNRFCSLSTCLSWPVTVRPCASEPKKKVFPDKLLFARWRHFILESR